jgi:F-type H+-transporting ATPase subunit epsilon
MRLKVMLPTEILLDQEVTRLVAEAPNGAFGILPRHIDFVSALSPGILLYEGPDGREKVLGVDEGILVKAGEEVLVSTRNAVTGDDLAELRERIQALFVDITQHERAARGAIARLEVGVVRRIIELQEGRR